MTTLEYTRIEDFDHAYYISEIAIAAALDAPVHYRNHRHYTQYADVVIHLPTDTIVKCRFPIDTIMRKCFIRDTWPPPMDFG